MNRKSEWKRRITLLLILFLAGALSSCRSMSVNVKEVLPMAEEQLQVATEAKMASATVSPISGSLTIMGVDFDPPLRYQNIAAAHGITLLVALENRGTQPAKGIILTATLVDKANSQRVIVRRRVYIDQIEGGQVKVQRFPRLEGLLLHKDYQLIVQVTSYATQQNILDQRNFSIHISSEGS